MVGAFFNLLGHISRAVYWLISRDRPFFSRHTRERFRPHVNSLTDNLIILCNEIYSFLSKVIIFAMSFIEFFLGTDNSLRLETYRASFGNFFGRELSLDIKLFFRSLISSI